jgi:[acyl-carrier-protein] S-malonyltransferase
MRTRWAFVFPGQGAQAVGMGKDLAEAHPEAMAVWDLADKTLGIPVKDTAWNGPEEALVQTDMAQPALLAAGVAVFRVLERLGLRPAATAGHSLGEYSALVAAGSLQYPEALRLVRARGVAMRAAAEAAGGGMAAVLGADPHRLDFLCRQIGNVAPANLNAPGQIVVSGADAALEALSARVKETGAKRLVRLPVSGGFDSPAMAPAAETMRTTLESALFQNAQSPVYANVTARQERKPIVIRENLEAQITGQVRWEDTIRNMFRDGYTHFVELGPGQVLAGLIRRIQPMAVVYSVGDPDSLAAFRGAAGI